MVSFEIEHGIQLNLASETLRYMGQTGETLEVALQKRTILLKTVDRL